MMFCKGAIVLMGVCLCRFCFNMNVGWDICLYQVGMTGWSGESFIMIYVEWYGVCNFVVFSVVVICVDYGDVLYVFHVCFDLCIFYGVDVLKSVV